MTQTGLVRVLAGPGLAMAIVIGVGLWQLSTGSAPASTPVARAVKQDLVVSVGGVGRIVQSKLIQSSGNRTIDDEILRGFPNWRLRPATLDSVPIAAWMDVPKR